MRAFSYYLFENFDAEAESKNPNNPRNFLGPKTDCILQSVAQAPLSYETACQQFPKATLDCLLENGILKTKGQFLAFDCPIFLAEDVDALRSLMAISAGKIVKQLEPCLPEINALCGKISNDFDVKTNLYHILCGIVFDGSLFDYLSDIGILSTHRIHASGLDYLSIIYEQCPELACYSSGLLCSYNRFANPSISLQSFGDANGSRLDFYRLYRLMEQGAVPERFQAAAQLLTRDGSRMGRDEILAEALRLVKGEPCNAAVEQALELLGYASGGEICVPVFSHNCRPIIEEIAKVTIDSIGQPIAHALMGMAEKLDITAVRHGVDKSELANELYHILFGTINEALVARKIVATPACIDGEGRYLKCIEVYGRLGT